MAYILTYLFFSRKWEEIGYALSEANTNILQKEEHVWNIEDLVGLLSVLLCPVIKVNEKLQQHNSGRKINKPTPLGMKVWVILSWKDYIQLRCLQEAKGIQNKWWKKVTITSCNHMTS